MGKLSKVIAKHSPAAIKTNEIDAYAGRKIAIDATQSLYQFLIAVRQNGSQLTNDNQETSHLSGLFYRTVRMMENGIKPVYIFGGKPPELKLGALGKREGIRAKAEQQLGEATEQGDKVAMERFERRSVKVTKEQCEEAKHLLKLMGIPVVEAPSEALAQCAELVRKGKLYATATEDMDALTFGSQLLIRHMTFNEAKKQPIREFSLDKILKAMELTHEQFVDLCILLGCDYCGKIRGIGPKKAFDLISEYKNIETILENLDLNKYPIPDGWKYKQARELFLKPEVIRADEIEEFGWAKLDVDEIVHFLCMQKGFSEDRVRSAIGRLQKGRMMGQQGRIEMFFKPTGVVTSTESPASKKRKQTEKQGRKGGKKRKI